MSSKVKSCFLLLLISFASIFPAGMIHAANDPYFNESSVTSPTIQWILSELGMGDVQEGPITRGYCLELMVRMTEKINVFSAEKATSYMKSRKRPIPNDWEELNDYQKTVLCLAVDNDIFYGEKKAEGVYVEWDRPITYYEALAFMIRCYYDKCFVLGNQVTFEELNQNWLDYAEDIGILYGRIPDFIKSDSYLSQGPYANKNKIMQKSNQEIEPKSFYHFLYHLLTVPYYNRVDRETLLLVQSCFLDNLYLESKEIDVKGLDW